MFILLEDFLFGRQINFHVDHNTEKETIVYRKKLQIQDTMSRKEREQLNEEEKLM